MDQPAPPRFVISPICFILAYVRYL